jgi:hypothetical protein
MRTGKGVGKGYWTHMVDSVGDGGFVPEVSVTPRKP